MQIYSGLNITYSDKYSGNGIFFLEPAGPSGLPWIKYAHADGSMLDYYERSDMIERITENRIWQCTQDEDQTNCNRENFDNFPRTKMFVKFAEEYKTAQRELAQCLFDDDARRGALSGSEIRN